MKVIIDNTTYIIGWAHIRPTKLRYNWKHHREEHIINDKKRSSTLCSIYKVEGSNRIPVIEKIAAVCSQKDKFNKDEGRRLSLDRALDVCDFTRDQRREIWKRYDLMVGKDAEEQDIPVS